jgi:uncharacterized protein
MPQSIVIGNEEIHLGEKRVISLSTYKLPTRTVIETPAYIYRAKIDGPVVLLMAGIHGDEINGIETIRQLIKCNYFENLNKGTVILVPVANIISFISGTRTLPDGKDLNRCFPGSLNGSLGRRIAFDITTKILPIIDFGIDFHTGALGRSNFPQIRCKLNDSKNLKLAMMFGAPYIMDSAFRDKSLRKEAANINKPILVYEGGEASRFDRHSINIAVEGVLRVLTAHEMISGKLQITNTNQESIVVQNSTWVRAKNAGLFQHKIKCGNKVSKNDIIGYITDPFGEKEEKVIAPLDGYIIGLNNTPLVNKGDAIVNLVY